MPGPNQKLDDEDALDEELELESRPASADAPTGGEEDSPLPEEEEEHRLTFRQKLIAAAVTAVSFLVFFVLFLPYGDIIRYTLGRARSAVAIDYTELNLSLFGADTASGLRVTLPGGAANLDAAEANSSLGWRGLLTGSPRGVLQLNDVQYSAQGLAVKAGQAALDLSLSGVNGPANRWEGEATLAAGNITFDSSPLPALPMVEIRPEDLAIKALRLRMQFRAGTVSFDNSSLTSDLFTARLSGAGRLGQAFAATNLDAQVCLVPSPQLESKNESLYRAYLLAGGSMGGELCVKITGPLANPQFANASAGSLNTMPGAPLPGATTPGPTPPAAPGGAPGTPPAP